MATVALPPGEAGLTSTLKALATPEQGSDRPAAARLASPQTQASLAKDGSKDVSRSLQGALEAEAGRGVAKAPGLVGTTASNGQFTEHLQQLRGRLQTVVQAVREVAQSLDEPHTIITNVRDQLSNSQAASLRATPNANTPRISQDVGSVTGMRDTRALPSGALGNVGLPADATAALTTKSGVKNAQAAVSSLSAALSGRDLPPSQAVSPSSFSTVSAQAAGPASGNTGSSLGGQQPSLLQRGGSSGTAAGAAPIPLAMIGINRVSGSTSGGGAAAAIRASSMNAARTAASLMSRTSSGGGAADPTAAAAGAAATVALRTGRSSSGGQPAGAANADAGWAASTGSGDAGQLDPMRSGGAIDPLEHPEMLRELWTLRSQVLAQERDMSEMVKQLSSKNAALDVAKAELQTKEKELGALTERLTRVLAGLQNFQEQQQQQLQKQQQQVNGSRSRRRSVTSDASVATEAVRTSSVATEVEEQQGDQQQRQAISGVGVGVQCEESVAAVTAMIETATSVPRSLSLGVRAEHMQLATMPDRRRGPWFVLRSVLGLLPTVLCVALLAYDKNVQEGVRGAHRTARNAAGSAVRGARNAVDSVRRRRTVTAAPATAVGAAAGVSLQPAPRSDASSLLPQSANDGAFASEDLLRCQSKWCSVVRPPDRLLRQGQY